MVEVEADQGIGRMLIVVPEDVCVDGDIDSRYGVVEIAGEESSESLASGYSATPRLELDAHLDAGKIEVVNDDDVGLGDNFGGNDGIARDELRDRMEAACAPEPAEGAGATADDTRGVDVLSLGAGLGLIATGAVLLLDQDGAIDLSFGLFGAVLALFFATTGIALLWRRPREPEVAAPTVSETLTAPAEPRASAPSRPERDRLRDIYRGGFGVALIGGAALIVLSRTGALDSLEDTVLTIVIVILALALVLAPFWWRLGRNLAAERAERIRSQERAEMAAHIHDSVLQTLTLVQKRADDPRAVAQLARAQERELRGWLFTGDRAPASASLAAALDEAAAEVEEAHRVPIEVVAVGDAPVGEAGNALLAAAREAMVNAAKFAPDAGEVAVYAELAPERSQVFVRDRGGGFDPEAVPEDRRGVRESIIGRMERSGGTARIRSGESGTEVELTIEPGAAP